MAGRGDGRARSVRGRVRRVGVGADLARHPADRELDRRQHPPQLRPAARARPADRRRDRAAGRPQPAGAARGRRSTTSGASTRIRRRSRSASGSCDAAGVEIVATYDTAGSAKLIAEQATDRRRGDRVGARRRGLRPRVAAVGIQDYDDNITRFLVIGRDGRRSARRTRRRSSSRCQRAGRAVQGAERVRAARHRPDEARVAADPRPAVGVPVLRRSGGRRATTCAARARSCTSPSSRRCARSAPIPQLESPRLRRGLRRRRCRKSESDARSSHGSNGATALDHGPSARRARAMLKAVGFTDADLKQAARRRRQHLDRDRPLQLPPARRSPPT